MARISPVRRLHQEAEASLVPYGEDEHPMGVVELVETFGELEFEYAALRKHCVILDQPHRAVIEIEGKDGVGFLQSMLTQDVARAAGFSCGHSFWLNTKGRIDADIRVLRLEDRLLLDVDIHAAERVVGTLTNFVIAEDVSIRSVQEDTHRFALHGPTAALLLHAVLDTPADGLADRTVFQASSGPAPVTVFRDDSTGVPGYELIVPSGAALEIYRRLVDLGREAEDGASPPESLAARVGLRPAGWHAFNVARIEAGTPLYNIDFGTESLPAETGVLEDRVSFTKGCYLGQEIVARMHARGHPKQRLVAIKFETHRDTPDSVPLQPVAECTLTPAAGGDPVGAVTSSALSPMLGVTPIAFAQAKWAHTEPGTVLTAVVEGVSLKGVVQPSLKFWPLRS
ncbi:MAG: YgfZ/GcvT domain-containing protein [Phycisphaerales bacterium]